MIKVGLCGFTMAVREYFEHFGVVEVQQTFYEPPAPRTILGWRERAPEGFEFTMKAWQLITHRSSSTTYRRLRTPLEHPGEAGAFQWTPTVLAGWEKTREACRLLRATAILFQCPASFRPTEENVANMRRFFAGVERPAGVRFLWEPRGDWPDALLTELCDELQLVHTVDPFLRPSIHKDVVYWRLHGIGNHYHVYTDAELASLASRIEPAAETYVMFNNIPRVGDAKRFVRVFNRGR